jgi:hypothetical protein
LSYGGASHISKAKYNNPEKAAKHVKILEAKVLQHRLIEQTGKAHRKSKSRALSTKRLTRLDKELEQYMRYVKKKCQKIKSRRIPFSPKASLWIRRTQV